MNYYKNRIYQHTKSMKLLSVFLSSLLFTVSPLCEYQGEARLMDAHSISQVYVCSTGENYRENISIQIETGETKSVIYPKIDVGYDPSVFIGKFLPGETEQILYSVNSGGSGAYSSFELYSFVDDHAKLLYYSGDFENTATAYLDGTTIVIDYLDRKLLLDATGLDLSGKREVTIGPLNTILPYYQGGYDQYNLMILQKIYIDYTANNAGYLATFVHLTLDGSSVINTGILNNFVP